MIESHHVAISFTASCQRLRALIILIFIFCLLHSYLVPLSSSSDCNSTSLPRIVCVCVCVLLLLRIEGIFCPDIWLGYIHLPSHFLLSPPVTWWLFSSPSSIDRLAVYSCVIHPPPPSPAPSCLLLTECGGRRYSTSVCLTEPTRMGVRAGGRWQVVTLEAAVWRTDQALLPECSCQPHLPIQC